MDASVDPPPPPPPATCAFHMSEHVWYGVLRALSGLDGQLRPLTFAVRDVLTASSTCKAAHRAGVHLMSAVASGAPHGGDAMAYARANNIRVSDQFCDKVPRRPEQVRVESRLPQETKALMRVMRRHWVSEAEAKKLFRVSASDLDAIHAGLHNHDAASQAPAAETQDEPGPPSCASSSRFFPIEHVREASYLRYATARGLADMHEKIRVAAKKRMETRAMRACLRVQLQAAMGQAVFEAYESGRLHGSQLSDEVRAAVDACTRAGLRAVDAEALERIRELSDQLSAKLAQLPQVLEGMHALLRADELRAQVLDRFCRHAHSGRARELDQMQRVSSVLDAIFPDFGEAACLGQEDWGCIRALLCSSSLEGTMAEYAQRSLEERHSLRLHITQIVAGWCVFRGTGDMFANPRVRRVLRLEDEYHYALGDAAMWDFATCDDELEERLDDLYRELTCDANA